MKRLNKFTRLPEEDQKLILNLCEKHTYKDVAQILAKPRDEGGLSFTTCESALCKFFYKSHPENISTAVLGQFAAGVRFNHQAYGEGNFEAILAMIQNRFIESLRAGKPLADLAADLRSLQRAQKCFLDDQKYRHKNEHTQDAYLAHINRLALLRDEPDFIDHNLDEDPGAGPCTVEDFQSEPTQLELDIDYARHLTGAELFRNPTYLREAARIVAARRLAARKQEYLRNHDVNPAFALTELAHPTPESLLKLQQQLEREEVRRLAGKEIADQNTSKTPAISNISNNFHSPIFTGKNP